MIEEHILDARDDEFLNVIDALLSDVLNKGAYFDKFNYDLASRYLDDSKLAQTNPQSYQKLSKICGQKVPYGNRTILLYPDPRFETNAAFLIEAANEYVRTAKDSKLASGRLVWHTFKRTFFKGEIYNRDDKEVFARQAAFERNKVRFLNAAELQLSNACKVDTLDLFSSYKASDRDGIYTDFIRKISSYDIGAEPQDQNYVAKQTVKLLVKVLDKSRGSNGAAKLKLLMPVFENAAKNAFYIDNVSYVDVSGSLGEKNKVYTLDKPLKLDILKRLRRSGLPFSARCQRFFEDEAVSTTSVINKMKIVQNVMKNSSRPFERKLEVMKKVYPLVEADLNNPLVEPKNDLILAYAGFLSDYASLQPEEKGFSVKRLEYMLKENINYRDRNIVQGNLFMNNVPLPKIDKKLVAEVADIYAGSVLTTHPEGECFNPDFHKNMTAMFAGIVTSHDYSKPEVQDLCERLAKGGDGAFEFRTMSRAVMAAYTMPRNPAVQSCSGARQSSL